MCTQLDQPPFPSLCKKISLLSEDKAVGFVSSSSFFTLQFGVRSGTVCFFILNYNKKEKEIVFVSCLSLLFILQQR